MLETVIIAIVIIASFVGVAWYAIRSSKQRNRSFLEELNQRMEPDLDDEFGAVFKQEMAQQTSDSEKPDIESDPTISLSDQARQQQAHTQTSSPVSNSVDIVIDEIVEQTPEPEQDQEPKQVQEKQVQEAKQTQVHKQTIGTTVIDWDMVISFTVIAPDNQPFSGLDLKTAFETLNFKFGDEMGIYHRMTAGARKTPLFSVANIIDPGTFEPQNVIAMMTPGILVFAKLPGPMNGLTLFDDLLETAQSLTEILHGTLCDDTRQPLSQDTIETMRGRILELNLSIQSEQSQYGNNGYSE